MPLSFPIADNVSCVVIDGLPLPDLPQETAFGCIVDFHFKNRRIPGLVRMVEAGVLCQGALVCLAGLYVLLMPLGGAVVAGAACLPVIDRCHALAPALQAGAGVGGPGPGVRGPLGSALAEEAVRPPAASEVKVDQGAPDLLTRGLNHLDAHADPLHVLVGHPLDPLLEHGAWGRWHEERGILERD